MTDVSKPSFIGMISAAPASSHSRFGYDSGAEMLYIDWNLDSNGVTNITRYSAVTPVLYSGYFGASDRDAYLKTISDHPETYAQDHVTE